MYTVIVFLLIGVILLVAGSVYFAPVVLYSLLIKNHIHSSWVPLRRIETKHLRPMTPYKPLQIQDEENLWFKFHIGDFSIPLPPEHPLYVVVPYFHSRSLFGIDLVGHNKVRKINFISAGTDELRIKLSHMKLYRFPIIQEVIHKHSAKKIWKDLFEMNLEQYPKTYEQAVYQLYILGLRQQIFQEDYQKISYDLENRIVIQRIPADEKNEFKEMILYLYGDKFYRFILKTKKDDHNALETRDRFITQVQVNSTGQSNANILYDEFKTFSYQDKVAQKGMLYLFSAWSHWPENLTFLKELVFYLEKNRNTLHQLRPLYDYAYKYYPNRFSFEKDKETTNPEALLNQKIRNEVHDNSNYISPSKMKVFKTKEEKQKYFLQKAKDNKKKRTKSLIFQ